jgi:thymidylate synthase (FAD)
VNIVEPYARLLSPSNPLQTMTQEDGVKLLRRIEYFGRFSHASEDDQTPDSWERFIKAVVMGHGDWSIVEHATVTVDALMDRGCSHEWVRHRLNSLTQASTRFINYEKKIPPSFIKPNFSTVARPFEAEQTWKDFIATAEHAYKAMLAAGCAPQIARSVFPNALATRIATTSNLRNWRHMMIMRTTKEAHPQFREISIPLLAQFKATVPLLFDDIEPLARQSDNLRLPR